ncbi:MAG: hypothetical protein IJ055_03765 [Oscillospiraceae bacterium]|nr:hypothetical protein [Oscillospiraceae bacterium]
MLTTIVTALILCAAEFLTILLASPMAKPGLVLRFLPEDIREAARDHPAPPKWKQMTAHLLLGLFLLSFLGGIAFLGLDGLRHGYGFWRLTGRFIVTLYLIKLFDIVVQDQWLVMTSGFFRRIFPETRDCAGWHDRSFNNKNQLIRIVVYPFLCMLTAALFLWIKGGAAG